MIHGRSSIFNNDEEKEKEKSKFIYSALDSKEQGTDP